MIKPVGDVEFSGGSGIFPADTNGEDGKNLPAILLLFPQVEGVGVFGYGDAPFAGDDGQTFSDAEEVVSLFVDLFYSLDSGAVTARDGGEIVSGRDFVDDGVAFPFAAGKFSMHSSGEIGADLVPVGRTAAAGRVFLHQKSGGNADYFIRRGERFQFGDNFVCARSLIGLIHRGISGITAGDGGTLLVPCLQRTSAVISIGSAAGIGSGASAIGAGV